MAVRSIARVADARGGLADKPAPGLDGQRAATVVQGAAAHLEYAKWICDTKTAHLTRGKARAKAIERLERDPTLQALYGYRCTACRTWHLTRKKNGRPLAARSKTPNAEFSGGPAAADSHTTGRP